MYNQSCRLQSEVPFFQYIMGIALGVRKRSFAINKRVKAERRRLVKLRIRRGQSKGPMVVWLRWAAKVQWKGCILNETWESEMDFPV